MKLTKEEAIELSIKKWEWIVEEWDAKYRLIINYEKLIRELPKLEFMNGHCGLCEFHDGECLTCQLGSGSGSGCDTDGHAWSNWYDNRTKENAQKVLDLIKSIK
jgi:hypothetical protein